MGAVGSIYVRADFAETEARSQPADDLTPVMLADFLSRFAIPKGKGTRAAIRKCALRATGHFWMQASKENA